MPKVVLDIDLQKLRSEYGQNFVYILKSLVTEIKRDLKQLKLSLEKSDEPNSRYFLHQLIGSSKLLQSEILTNALREVQKKVHQFEFDVAACKDLEEFTQDVGIYLQQELQDFGVNHVVVFAEDLTSEVVLKQQMTSFGARVSCVDSAEKLEEELMMNLPEVLFVSKSCKKDVQTDLSSEFLGTTINFLGDEQPNPSELIGELNHYLQQRFI